MIELLYWAEQATGNAWSALPGSPFDGAHAAPCLVPCRIPVLSEMSAVAPGDLDILHTVQDLTKGFRA